jgi:putative PIN family toxin of toxin-antitoxin system
VPRAVLDPNVLIAALMSPRGAPAALYLAPARGDLEVVVSPLLLAELDRVLARPKFRRYASLEQARAFVGAVARLSVLVDYPRRTAAQSRSRRRLPRVARERGRRRRARVG